MKKTDIKLLFPKPIKKKKTTRKGLIRKLDKAVSLYVIARDGKCVMCGSTKQLGWGHIFSRRALSTRWDLENVHAQCWPHNFRHTFEPYAYYRWHIEKFGLNSFDNLYQRHKQVKKWKNFELAELLRHFEFLTPKGLKENERV